MKYIFILFFLVLGCTTSPVDDTAPSKSIEDAFNLPADAVDKIVAVKNSEQVAKKEQSATSTSKKVVSKKKDKKKLSAEVAKKEPTLPEDYPPSYLELDKRSEKLWKQVNPPIRLGEKSVYRITYFGVTVGDAVVENLGKDAIGDRQAHHYQLRLQSAPFYRAIYYLDDYLDSYIDVETLTPLKYSLRQRESKQEVDDLQLFSQKDRKTYFWYRRLKKADNSVKKKQTEAYIPRLFLDHFSGFIYMRGLSLKDHPMVEFPVVSRAEVSLMQMKFLKEEEISVMDKTFKAWKVSVEAKLHDGLKKKGDLFFWYDAGENHRLLKFEGKIKIGTVKGELVDYDAGKSQPN